MNKVLYALIIIFSLYFILNITNSIINTSKFLFKDIVHNYIIYNKIYHKNNITYIYLLDNIDYYLTYSKSIKNKTCYFIISIINLRKENISLNNITLIFNSKLIKNYSISEIYPDKIWCNKELINIKIKCPQNIKNSLEIIFNNNTKSYILNTTITLT